MPGTRTPTRPWARGGMEGRGDFGEGKEWSVVPIVGANGGLVCDVVVDPAGPTEEEALIGAILSMGRG